MAQLDAGPTGDKEVAGLMGLATVFCRDLIMKYFLQISPFRWFEKGSCQVN